MKKFMIFGLVFVLVLAFASMGVGYKWPPKKGHELHVGYPTIQAAINAASDGDTIIVHEGMYAEQLTINKSLKLKGSGAASTRIQPTAGTLTGDADGYKNIVTISGAGVNVEFTGFTVSGPGTATGGSINAGIRVRDSAYANIHHNNIVDIRNEPLIGSYQNVYGIVVGCCYWMGPERTGTATIANNTIIGYQKGGIEVGGAGSSATIKNNMITGIGQTDILAAYGICISRSATATITGNLIEENDYYDSPYSAGQGILTWFPESGPQIIKENEIRNNCQGISIFGRGQDALIERNNIHDNVQYGVFLAADVTNTTIRYNDILNNGTNRNPPYDAGILVLDIPRDYDLPPGGAGNQAHHNNIVGNYRGVNVHQDNPNPADMFDAENNWWGDKSGPEDATGTHDVPPCTGDPTTEVNADGKGDTVIGNVDYCPWLKRAVKTRPPRPHWPKWPTWPK